MPEQPLLRLDWSNENSEKSLEIVYTKAILINRGAVEWYSKAKRSKKHWAQNIRIASIVIGAAAALLPTIGEMLQKNGKYFSSGWTTILLGVVGTLLLLDRFFGFSSAWMRYIVAELQLNQILQEFELDWENERSNWQGNIPTKDQINQMLAKVKALTSQINIIIRDETNVWVQEFQNNIKNLDESLKTKPALQEPGAINITITNEEVAKKGWELIIDNGNPEVFKGYTAGKRNITPGRHEITVRAKINGDDLQAGKVISVPPGNICEEKLTLI